MPWWRHCFQKSFFTHESTAVGTGVLTWIFFLFNRWSGIHIDHLLRNITLLSTKHCFSSNVCFPNVPYLQITVLSQLPTNITLSCNSQSNKINVKIPIWLFIALEKHHGDGILRQDAEKAFKSISWIYILRHLIDIHQDYVWMLWFLDSGGWACHFPPDSPNALSFLNTLKSATNSSVIYPAIYPIEQKVIARTQRFYNAALGCQNSSTDQLIIFHYVRWRASRPRSRCN